LQSNFFDPHVREIKDFVFILGENFAIYKKKQLGMVMRHFR
jgi:hypothetical protein